MVAPHVVEHVVKYRRNIIVQLLLTTPLLLDAFLTKYVEQVAYLHHMEQVCGFHSQDWLGCLHTVQNFIDLLRQSFSVATPPFHTAYQDCDDVETLFEMQPYGEEYELVNHNTISFCDFETAILQNTFVSFPKEGGGLFTMVTDTFTFLFSCPSYLEDNMDPGFMFFELLYACFDYEQSVLCFPYGIQELLSTMRSYQENNDSLLSEIGPEAFFDPNVIIYDSFDFEELYPSLSKQSMLKYFHLLEHMLEKISFQFKLVYLYSFIRENDVFTLSGSPKLLVQTTCK